MRTILIIAISLLTAFANAQPASINKEKKLATAKYAGEYSYGDTTGPNGGITIYPETDSTILFFVDITVGPPSYNLGQHYGRMVIKNGSGIYYMNEDSTAKGCKWMVTITEKLLTIKTIDDGYDCGFGGNVIADNKYQCTSHSISEYFIDGHGGKIFI